MQGTNLVFCGGAFSGTPCLREVSLQRIIPSPRNILTPSPVRDTLAPSSLRRRANEDICSSSSLAAVNFGSGISKIRSPISPSDFRDASHHHEYFHFSKRSTAKKNWSLEISSDLCEDFSCRW